jgi:hypothetical protein
VEDSRKYKDMMAWLEGKVKDRQVNLYLTLDDSLI